ncbi:hypothetical protein MNBD_DELTA01-580 [hydrothermal vent metagenome]|uniref:HNH endonuclease 5 domain-containing protein n=1 Tax=hydrothermal vent metagenome TaxID=652676 RepID=A0A3B0QTD0_9ZZZZ
MINYKKNKRNRTDNCNICTERKKLSWDHVPPKGGIEVTKIQIEPLYKQRAGKERGLTISQNGLKYRTICQDCNSLLGSKYDPVLNDLSINIGRHLISKIHLPETINHPTYPAALLRSILGHLLAARVENCETEFEEKIRTFLLNENETLSKDISVFYWVFPYECTVVSRDFLMPATRGNYKEWGYFNVLKYFPIAYLITDLKKYEGLNELTKFRNLENNDTEKIVIDLTDIKDPGWPEYITRENIVLVGEEGANSIHAKPKK